MPVQELSTPNIVEWHVSLARQTQDALRISEVSNNSLVGTPQIVCNDKLEFRIYFYDEQVLEGQSGPSLVNIKYQAGTFVGVNAVAAEGDSDQELWIVGDFELITTGSGEDERCYYRGFVNTATDEMDALFVSDNSAPIIVNIQVADFAGSGANKRRTVAYFTANGLKDMYDDGSTQAVETPGAILTTDLPLMFTALSHTFDAAENYAITNTAMRWDATLFATVEQGAGAYTANVVLETSSASAGMRRNIKFDVETGENPTVNVRNATSGGAVLYTIVGDFAVPQRVTAVFVYDGTAWVHIGIFQTGNLPTPPTGTCRFYNGKLYHWNDDTALWHFQFPVGPDGAVGTSWSDGETLP